MKRIVAALICFGLGPALAIGAQAYTWGTKLTLANGLESLQVVHSLDGVEQPFQVRMQLPLRGAAYQKITIWPTRYKSFTGESACANPCSLAMPLHYGSPKLRAEYFNASGVPVRESQWYDIPQAVPAPLTSYKMPLEVIGFAPFRLPVQVNIPSNADLSGALRLYAHCHRCSYEGKARVRVNGRAWLPIQAATVSLLNNPLGASPTSLDQAQSLLEFTLPLANGTLTPGPNTVEWEYAAENFQGQSGYRILSFGLFGPDRNVTSLSISGSTVTVTANAHGLTSGQDVRIDSFRGAAWRVNGVKRNVEVTGVNTFRFTIPEADGKRDGTWNYAGVKVAPALNDFDAFVEDDPQTWTAPAGASVSAGQAAYVAANSLLDPTYPGRENIKAACSDCHARDGRDLKYFNYSNWSNLVRSQWHALSEQKSKDIAAYIRSHNSSAPGRPWRPPYQPAPCATTVSAYDWSGCATETDILPHDAGMYEQLFGATPDAGDFSPSRTDATFQNMRISLQLLDWNDWLPRISPMDWYDTPLNAAAYPRANWPTSDLRARYNDLRNGYTGVCPGAGCASYVSSGAQAFNWGAMRPTTLTQWWSLEGINGCNGRPAVAGCGSGTNTPENGLSIAVYSVGLWVATKIWEVLHEFDLEQYGNQFYPTQGLSRSVPSAAPFQSSTDLSKARIQSGTLAGKIPGIFDSSAAAEATSSAAWYHLQGIWMPTRNRPTGYDSIQPMDVPYMFGKLKGSATSGRALFLTQLVQQQFTRFKDNYPGRAGFAESWLTNTVYPGILVSNDGWNQNWISIPPEDRSSVRAATLDAIYTKWLDLVCATEANGSAPLFTAAQWQAGGYLLPTSMVYDGSNSILDQLWQMLIYGGAYGLSQTVKDRGASCAAGLANGPQAQLAAAANATQTTLTLQGVPSNWPTENHQFVLGSERITCGWRSGSTVGACTRGADGTTASSHAGGAAAQIRIRWDVAKNSTACTLNPDNLTVDVGACFGVKP